MGYSPENVVILMNQTLQTNDEIRLKRDGSSLTVGRDSCCDIVITGVGVSRRHARIFCSPSNPTISDLRSTYGIRINGEAVREGLLLPNSRINIGIHTFIVILEDDYIVLRRLQGVDKNIYSTAADFVDSQIRIGRDPDNGVCLSHQLVSRFHAIIKRRDDGFYIVKDCGSTNGTFVNGKPVRQAVVGEGEIIQIGPYRFVLENGRLFKANDYNKIKIEALNVTVQREKRPIVNNVSVALNPGEFVAVLGPSGAGKTTFARALSGQIKLSSGAIFINGLPLGSFSDAFSSIIGFVSQQILLRDELTVSETFDEQSFLRLPRDCNIIERQERIKEVIEFLELDNLRNRRISELSGGEARRVHIGIELLSSPGLLFLDEPLSGLDPGLIARFMKMFRSIADRGHTLLLTTHILEQLDLCNRVVFLNKGELLFDGSPHKLTSTFMVKRVADIYEKIREDVIRVPQLASEQTLIKKHENIVETEKRNDFDVKLRKFRNASFLRQTAVLISRYSKIAVRDIRNTILLLLQSPLIALLLAFVYGTHSKKMPLSFYFCLSISAIWIGGVNAVREISKEWNLIIREIRVGVSFAAFATAKIVVLSYLAIVQTAIFISCLDIIFSNYSPGVETAMILGVGCICGSLLGLCISAFSGNVNRSLSLLPVFFIPQIFFSGILIPFDSMPTLGYLLSQLTIAKPIFSMMKKTELLNFSINELQEWRTLFFLCAILIILIMIGIRINCQRRTHVA